MFNQIPDRKKYPIEHHYPEDVRICFFARLEQETILSSLQGCYTCIQLDANAKLGSNIIEGDPHQMSGKGQLLWGMVERNDLIVCNAQDICKGVITRRETTRGTEESVIDFLILSKELFEHLTNVTVDEGINFSLARYTKIKSGVKDTESDHNPIIAKFDFRKSNVKNTNERQEVFKFSDTAGQEKFFNLTSGNTLINCFDN